MNASLLNANTSLNNISNINMNNNDDEGSDLSLTDL